MQQNFYPYILEYKPGSCEEHFYSLRHRNFYGKVPSGHELAKSLPALKNHTPYYIVFAEDVGKYVAILNNVFGTAYSNLEKLENDVKEYCDKKRANGWKFSSNNSSQGGRKSRRRRVHRRGTSRRRQ